MGKTYSTPLISSESTLETTALACAKTTDSAPWSWHWSSAYDTFTGHFGGGFGGSESRSGSAGIGWGPGGTSHSTTYVEGMCLNWVTYSS